MEIKSVKKIGSYKIFHDKKLILEYYSGEITADDLIHLKEIIFTEENYKFSYDAVLDFRNAILLIDNQGITDLIHFFRSRFSNTATRNVAYLTSRPNEVVIAIQYALKLEQYSDLNIIPQIFSSTEAVASWLSDHSISENDLNIYFKDLMEAANHL